MGGSQWQCLVNTPYESAINSIQIPGLPVFAYHGYHQNAEATLKQALTQAPALRLPDPEKAFQLYIHEREGIALGVLTQRLGSEPQPVAYLSKRLDPTTQDWPPNFCGKICDSFCKGNGLRNLSI